MKNNNIFFAFIFIAHTMLFPMGETQDMVILQHGFKKLLPALENIDVSPLYGGGESIRKKFRCLVDGKLYVACVLSAPLAQKKTEIEAHRLAMQLGTAPTLYYYDNEYTLEIMDFLEGNTLSIKEGSDALLLDQLARGLHALGMLKLDAPKKDIFACIRKWYTTAIAQKTPISSLLMEALKKVENLEREIDDEHYPFVLCHADLHTRNIFFKQEKLSIIDWEETAFCYDFFDLASYSVFACLGEAADAYLLQKYLQCTPDSNDLKRFQLMKRVIPVYDGFRALGTLENLENLASKAQLIIEDYSYYAALWANDPTANSPEFFYEFGLSGLQKFLKK